MYFEAMGCLAWFLVKGMVSTVSQEEIFTNRLTSTKTKDTDRLPCRDPLHPDGTAMFLEGKGPV